MDGVMLTILAAAACFRLMSLRKFWLLPKRQGENWFLTTEVGPDFYSGAGTSLVRSYRAWLVAPLAIDAVVVGLLVAAGRPEYAIYEQAASFVVTSVFYHLVTIHFGQRVRALAAPGTPATQSAATQPAATGHAVEVPLSGLPTPKASDPRKCV